MLLMNIKIVVWQLILTVFVAIAFEAPRAVAEDVNLVAPMNDFLLLEPALPPPKGGPFGYGPTGGAPQWEIVQWNMPGGKLPLFTSDAAGDNLHLHSRTKVAGIRLAFSGQGEQKSTHVVLHQDGSFIPCMTAAGQAKEWDFFLSPGGDHIPAPGRPGMLMLGANNPSLDQMDKLMEYATVKVTGTVAPKPKGCHVNLGSTLMAMYLSNHTSHQTMSYQLKLSRICGKNERVKLNGCDDGTHREQSYYSKNNPFGLDDYLPLLGQPWIRSGETRQIAVNLKPRLVKAITALPSADTDMSHWVITGVYIGQHVWGDVALWSEWQNYRLVALTNNRYHVLRK